jgi:hypothetical protein
VVPWPPALFVYCVLGTSPSRAPFFIMALGMGLCVGLVGLGLYVMAIFRFRECR